jgi:hypothetical protein
MARKSDLLGDMIHSVINHVIENTTKFEHFCQTNTWLAKFSEFTFNSLLKIASFGWIHLWRLAQYKDTVFPSQKPFLLSYFSDYPTTTTTFV